MTTLTEWTNRLASTARPQGERYGGGQDRPLHGYVMTMAAYGNLAWSPPG